MSNPTTVLRIPNPVPEHLDPESLLPRFGLRSFRPGQREVVDALASGADCLCVMPTGGGKSLCYQLPALARQGTTIVVSPLIALMKDQVDTLRQRGMAARLINSSLSAREQEDAMDEMAAGKLDLIYVAPERLRNGRFLEKVSQANVTLLAVDEAHCVSEWGHDFRPDYSRLGRFRDRYLGGVQTIALTATATPTVRDDICELLNLKQPRVFVTGFARTNLRFAVWQCNNDAAKQTVLSDYLRGQSGAGIIYAATRKRCEEIAEWLPKKTGRAIGVYHAGLHPDDRRNVQEAFMSGKLSAIVATNAFGMGIDKSDIRFVIHYNMPGSLEAYYQEAGRAGRDGKTSDCLLLFSFADRSIQEFFIENRYPSRETVKKVYEYLLSREEDPIELTLEQVREAISVRDGTEAIGTSETLIARAGVLKRLDSGSNQAVIRIDSDVPTLLDFIPREAKLKRKVMAAIEKVIGTRRGEDVFVRPSYLATMAGVDREKCARVLRELQRLKSFDYIPPFRGRAVHFTTREIPFEKLEIDFDELARRKQAEYDKLESVIEFARASRCRQHVILDYFGDPNADKCDQCDRCDSTVTQKMMQGDGKVVTGSELAVTNIKPRSSDEESALLTGIRVVLSGVTRTHGRLGKNLIAQMLGGSQNKRLTGLRLHQLSTYGRLEGLKQNEIIDVIDSCLAAGLLDQKEISEKRPTVHMTDLGRAVMNLEQSLPLSLQIKPRLAKKLSDVAAKIQSAETSCEPKLETTTTVESRNETRDEKPLIAPVPMPESTDHGLQLTDLIPEDPEARLTKELIERIKRFRHRRSVALNVSPHRVLSGAAMERIAQTRPANSTQLESIEGIGPEFIEAYGNDLLEVIATAMSEFEAENPMVICNVPKLSVPSKQTVAPETIQPLPSMIDSRHAYWTWKLFRDGYSMQQILEIRQINMETIVDHLIVASSGGQPIQANWIDDARGKSRLEASIAKVGSS